jgi:hypothetical protein
MLWKLRGLGHSLLVTNSEEIGCLGARALMKEAALAQELNEHAFAIEFDRRGHRDLVFYHVSTREFRRWCLANFPGYRRTQGVFTDIGVLCRRMCGVNVSVGYHDPHTPGETLRYDHWIRTLRLAKELLSKEGIPAFRRPTRRGAFGLIDNNPYTRRK